MASDPKTIGLLYPGEMGAAVGALLRSRGYNVVTTLGGRGAKTVDRCKSAGITVLGSLHDVVRGANVVISVVPPAAAEDLVQDYCKLAHLAPPDTIFVDANSIGPELSNSLASQIGQHGIAFVDAAINGLAKNLTTTCTLFLSGTRAPEIAAMFEGGMRFRVIGDQPGRASAMKMLLSGLSKGVCALFVETARTAQQHGMLPEMISAYTEIYPGVMAIVDRMLPTYAQHSARRADEMRELEQTAQAAGIEPCVLASIRELHELLAGVDYGADSNAGLSVTALMQRLADAELLSAATSVGNMSLANGQNLSQYSRENHHGK